MTEKAMLAAIHRQWKKGEGPHHQSMTGSSMTYAGTPDQYYEGVYGNAFCEYKFCKFRTLSKTIDTSKLVTANQYAWLTRAATNGICCMVGIGYKDKKGKIWVAFVHATVAWNRVIDTAHYDWLDTKDAAQYIVDCVGESS